MLRFFTATFLLFTQTVSAQQIEALNLRCEYKTNPLGIEAAALRLSWELHSNQRNVLQTAYRILVSDNSEALKRNVGNVWDSKKVASDASIQVPYTGKPLQPTKTYYWKVMVWGNKNNVSAWSKEANWQMGLLTAADWKGAQWIAYDKIPDSLVDVLPLGSKGDKYLGNNTLPLLRKYFTIRKPVKKATMFISGLGHFEMSLNGKKVGDHFLDPGWTKYDKQALYVPFDLTEQLQQGANAIGVMLGNGFYYIPPVKERYRKLKVAFGYPKMICRLAIEYSDGSSEDIVSDASWKAAKSPIVFSSIYGGEDYDANREQPGWDTPNFNDQSWHAALIVDGPSTLNSQMPEPVKVMETFTPKKVTQPQPNVWVYDLGQNASGIPQITVQGKKGDTIRITPAELLKEDGTANQRASGSPYYLTYVLKGNGTETWQPRFTYYGFRYVQINGGVPQGETNTQNLPVVMEVKGQHIRNAANRIGTFTSSNELFNRTNTLIDWAIKSNMVSVFTDCPHREKLGWLEQDHLMGNSVRFNYDVANLCRKLLTDMRYSQTDEGLIPEIAPEYVQFDWGGDMFRDSPEWGSAGIILPWYLYQWYGDKQVLAENYSMMQRYIAYLKTKANGHILKQGLGDWYDIGPKPPGVSQLTPMGVTGTATFYYDLNILSKIAQLLGKPQDASGYQNLAVDVKQAFNDTFFNKETKQYANGSQTANAMAVYMKLVEPQYKDAVVENIVKDIRSRNNSLTAGDIGYRYLLRVLNDEGRSNVIFDMNSRSDVPGYGYQLAKGATALTESWQAFPTASNNHFMLGHLMEWFYDGLAGIKQAENSKAYKNIVIRPEVVGDVTHAKATYQSPYGIIVSEWKKENDRFELATEIPANTTAILFIPATRTAQISENGVLLKNKKDIKFDGIKDGRAIVTVGSGRYTFTVSGADKITAK
ncbi:MAG: family 78 glycoside hydrolase catalytic domain [Flavisolibacter sp.]|nr:family 78 glycoside hydrolase catalytic domain [Flavisolibacter sp.]